MSLEAASMIVSPSEASVTTNEAKPLKPCCACPQTKKARDECITLYGEDACSKFIEEHNQCLRSHGFNVK
jgi:cytochrome c oxidase assembly protein subunit 17